MTIKEFKKFFEMKYPLRRAEKWDNSGLLYSDKRKVVSNVVVALDLTTDVMNKAIETKTDLIIVHHPFIFGEELKDRKKDFPDAPYKKQIHERLVNTGIAVYVAHTNFDSSSDGMPSAIINELGFESRDISGTNYGKIFEAKLNFNELKELFFNSFGLKCFSSNIDKNKTYNKFSVFPGSISSKCILEAKKEGVEVIVTSDVKWSQWLIIEELELKVIQVSHSLEDIFTKKVTAMLSTKFREINVLPIFTKEITN